MAINVLPQKVYNRIAAGEVVERPASVVKELVENSLDAGAKKIRIEITGGGSEEISVADDGCGISKEDLPLAFLPHATSKISSVEDLNGIETLGFRGEALASIASVSKVTLSSKQKGSETGFKIEANGGEISKVSEVARLDGTTLVMRELFFNTPVRAKFLKKPKAEEQEVTHLVEKFMMARPDVDFCYVVDGKEVYRHASGTLDEVAYLLYGREVHDNLLQLHHEEDGIVVSGYIVSPKISKPNRTFQSLFVNGRYVENYMISACVQGSFEGVLMKGRYPIYIIKLQVPFDRVDVNVHPNKKEVKFDNSSRIFSIVRRAVEKALMGANLIAEFNYEKEEDWKKLVIQNEENPAQTDFNSFQKGKLDKLDENEGASYKPDDESLYQPLPKSDSTGIDIFDVPDFSNVKADERNKNKQGGRIFFDHSGDSLLHEVEVSVRRDIEKEKVAKNEPINSFKEEKFLTADAEEIKIVGVVFKTYIITEFGDSLYILDQHAMHERQNYDRLKKEIEQHNVSQQNLLVPYEIKLLSKDAEIFETSLENLRQIGFEIVQNGNNFAVTAVPFVLSGINLQNFVDELLKEDILKDRTASDIINEKLCQTACKHSIRAGDSVSKEEILYLINQLKKGVPLCPHGRPIIAKITQKDLEKMFKRTL